ncbi:MAG: O-antigen ligase family protein [Cytophagales bacterium]|nr:O-antigen ligase family protein [Cytophagales bacterium]
MWVKNVFKDPATGRYDSHLVLFFLNVFLVVVGYGLRGAAFQATKLGRMGLVAVALVALFARPGAYRFVFRGDKSWVLWVFILVNLLVLAFSVDFLKSAARIAAWLPFLVYINYFIVYLFRKYDKETARYKLLQLFSLAYLYPLALLFVYANPVVNRNIYGRVISGYFSNVLGWAAIVSFVLAVDVLNNLAPVKRYRFFLVGVVGLSLLTLLTTGSRSSYLCLVVSVVVLVVNSKRMGAAAKLLILIGVTGATYVMLADPDSALNNRIRKSEQQLQQGESRFEMAEMALETMTQRPGLLITGFGYDNFREGISYYRGITLDLPSHNSYLELFITTGFFSFILFLVFLVLNGIGLYLAYDVRKFVFFPTFMIIPFFESNLNAGQFLFFPWMTFMFYYLHRQSWQIPVPAPPVPSAGGQSVTV